MSDPGSTPPPPDPANPYGQPANPYGQPPNPYAQPPSQPGQYGQPYPQYGQPGGYGQQPYPGYGPAPGAPVYDYAHWIKRVGGYLIDGVITALTGIPAYALVIAGTSVGTQDMHTYTDANGVSHTTGDWNSAGTPLVVIGAILYLLPLAFFVWNTCLRQGRTGYSIGKGVVGIRLVNERSGQPIGGGMAFLRYLCHIVDSIACYIGWLWPLWDRKRQTFADKILSTVVINQPKGQPAAPPRW